jgi:hypothetical protein
MDGWMAMLMEKVKTAEAIGTRVVDTIQRIKHMDINNKQTNKTNRER